MLKKEDIFQKIKDRIYEGHYWPREQLIEIKLAEEMGVSRTIIREVLKELSIKGLITILPHKGAFVSEMSYENMLEFLQLEAILESSAAYLATERLGEVQIAELVKLVKISQTLAESEIQAWANYNWKFHKIIVSSCGNRKLIGMIRDNVRFVKYWFVKLSLPEEIIHRNEGHEQIVRALSLRKPDDARSLMERHILFAAESLLSRIRTSNPNLKMRCMEIQS